MRPTRFGVQALAFYALLLLAFFAAPYQNLFFLLLSFLSIVLLLTPWWARRNLVGLRGELAPIAPGPAGVAPVLRVRVLGDARRRFGVGCRVQVGEHEATVAPATLVLGEAELECGLPPLPRGVHPIRGAELVSSHPFGFLRARRPLQAPPDFVVHPAPAPLGGAQTCGALLSRMGLRPARGGDDPTPSSVRPWRAGDALRAVHWRQSARHGTLVVRECEGGLGTGFGVVLDRRVPPEQLEPALSLITALALLCRERKEPMTVLAQEHVLTYGKAQRPWDELLRWLAAVQPLPAGAAPPPPAPPEMLRLPQALAPRSWR